MRVSRRIFIAAAAGAGIGAAQEFRIRGADIKLGVATYSLRKFSREQAIDMVHQLGTPYINVKEVHLPFGSTADEIRAARKQFAAAGLQVVGIGNVNFIEDEEPAMRKKFEYARDLGAPLMVCAPKPEQMPTLNKLVQEFDIKIALHNHGPEDPYFPGPKEVLKAVRDLDPRCGWCMDVGHTVRTGADPVQAIHQAGARLLAMHIKDLADLSKKESQVVVGRGRIPIRGIFEALVQVGYKGSVDLEYEIEENNPLPGMQASFAFMRSVLSAMH